MNKNILVIVLLVLVAAVAGVFLMKKGKAPATSDVNPPVDATDKERAVADKIGDEIGDKMKAISDKLAKGEITEEEAETQMKEVAFSSKAVQNEFAIQKEKMPKVMKVTEMYRKCLGGAATKAAAVVCFNKADKEAEKLGLNDNLDEEDKAMPAEFENWAKEKTSFLEGLDKDMGQMKKIQGCYAAGEMEKVVECIDKLSIPAQ